MGPGVLAGLASLRLGGEGVARAMFRQLPEPKVLIETGGGHNRAGFGDGAPLADALNRFWPVSAPRARSDSE